MTNVFSFFSGLKSTYQYVSDPYAFYKSIKGGQDPVRKRMILGEYFITNSAAGAREVLVADNSLFAVGDNMQVLEPVLGNKSIFLLADKEHMDERRMLTPPFTPKNIQSYAERMRLLTEHNTRNWQPGKRIVLKDMTYQVSLDIIIDVVFGVREADKAQQLGKALLDTLELMAPSILYFPFLRKRFFSPWKLFSDAKENADRLIYELIESRKAETMADETRDDTLSLLLSATEENGQPIKKKTIRDHLVTMLAAGYETTGASIAWAIYHLLRDKVRLEKLRAELDELPDDAPASAYAKLPYLSAVCNETLRIYPIVLDIERKMREDWTLLGTPIPAGADVLVSILNIHKDPELYPEPDTFNPERFIERNYTPAEFLPFGGSIRKCIGANFALFEMKVVIGSLIRNWDLALEKDEAIKPVRRHITLVPEGGVPLVVRARREVLLPELQAVS